MTRHYQARRVVGVCGLVCRMVVGVCGLVCRMDAIRSANETPDTPIVDIDIDIDMMMKSDLYFSLAIHMKRDV